MFILRKVYTNVCRLLLAVVFLFSGFVKANDPLGFQYKLADYVSAFGLSSYVSDWSLLLFAIGLATLEFLLGIYLLLGINRSFSSVVVTFFMLVMTPFTLYLALYNPVSNCGCFGDAIVLDNWETFWKNVVLLVASFSLLCWRKDVLRLITHRTEWLISTYSLLYIIIFSVYCLQNLPVFDFRPYSIGTDIAKGMEIPEGKNPPLYETVYIMEKDGEQREFSENDYPDESWDFVDRRTFLKEEGYIPPIHDFALIRQQDGVDITQDVLDDEGYTFLMVAYDLEKADDGYSDLFNELYEYSKFNGYKFYCLTASSDPYIDTWNDWTGSEYPFCHVDDITLKTMIRSNPGFILLKDGIIIKKWSARQVPDEYQLTSTLDELPIGTLSQEDELTKIIHTLLWFLLPFAFILFLDRLTNGIITRRLQKLGEFGEKTILTRKINNKEEK